MNWYVLLLIVLLLVMWTGFSIMIQNGVHDELEKGCNSFGDYIISIQDDFNGQHRHATAHYVTSCIIGT